MIWWLVSWAINNEKDPTLGRSGRKHSLPNVRKSKSKSLDVGMNDFHLKSKKVVGVATAQHRKGYVVCDAVRGGGRSRTTQGL